MTSQSHRWTREPALATVSLIVIFLAINAVAIWSLVEGRRGARQAASSELELRTRADARSLEAILATLRGDFLLITRSKPLISFLDSRQQEDPLVRRWSRLDAESTLLLFLEAHPSVERLTFEDAEGRALVLAGRRQGTPTLMAIEDPSTGGRALYQGTFQVGSQGRLRAVLDPGGLLAISSPGLGDRLRIDRDDEIPPAAPGELSSQMPVTDESWQPPIAWWLVRREEESALLRSVESLARRYRATVVLNVTVMTLTLVLGALALRQVRRAARLEAEHEQEKRVRELERQLMHSERLASVGRLAAGLAHEINNPLEGMSNYLALLEDDLAAGRADDAPKLTARLREGLQRVAGITRQVLSFSAPGKAPKSWVDLQTVLREAVELARVARDIRDVEIWFEAGEELQVRGNPIQLGQVFLNLLLNASQSQTQGGEVEIHAVRQEGRVSIQVADRGPGLSEDVLKHLFEPFFSTRDSTGLGLAVCHGIVTDHGGTIEGRNRAKGGAVFEVGLPLGEKSLGEGNT